ncbi:hypothetical protein ACHAWF_017654 [Thalassiosira exigua]
MANTEGLSDAALNSLLAMPSPEEEQRRQRSSRSDRNGAAAAGHAGKTSAPLFSRRSLARREQMMELGQGETPSATVIRSSKAPKIYPASSLKPKRSQMACVDDINITELASPHTTQESKTNGCDDTVESVDDSMKSIDHRPVILSESVRERPITNHGMDTHSSAAGTMKRESRFKQRNRNRNEMAKPPAGGFPSLDIAPVGAFTRRGKSGGISDSQKAIGRIEDRSRNNTPPVKPDGSRDNTPPLNRTGLADAGNGDGSASDAMLANMSLDEIREGLDEVKSILSEKSIDFLRKRGRVRLAKAKQTESSEPVILPTEEDEPHEVSTMHAESRMLHSSLDTCKTLTNREEIQLEENRSKEEKEKMAQLLSSVRTREDMDTVFEEALKLGIAAEMPSSSLGTVPGQEGMCERMTNLHMFTSLLRSTAPRQRLLGARGVCNVLEEDLRARSCSNYLDERESMRKSYPPLLPVALRCLLDESIATFQTSGGRLLLSIVLRCLHSLLSLFVHPYHVINVSPSTLSSDDPFVLFQTCFMNDISHIPPSTELYPPTQIKPVGEGAACYRAESSAATAETDSKAFYADPAWTLLSRMRILPCLSDVLLCLSTDYSMGLGISASTTGSICGILAMVAARSSGAAGALSRHQGILPFLISHCLSPSIGMMGKESDDSEKKECAATHAGLFDPEAALPALILLCHLARQSRDIAELQMPFQTIIPDLQAILCGEAENDKELEVQIWSLVLLRILIKYGLAAEHVQSLIGILAPRVELMRPGNRLGAHCLIFFATICNASRTVQLIENSQGCQTLPTIPETNNTLHMTGIWLSSSVRNCISSFQSVVIGNDESHMKLASAQLQLLASYMSTAAPTKGASSIPILSNNSCFKVIEATLVSDMFGSALDIALRSSFDSFWHICNGDREHSLEKEAVACSFVSSFISLVKTACKEGLNPALNRKVIDKIIERLEKFSGRSCSSQASIRSSLHPSRQSWFIESEFSTLQFLCDNDDGVGDIQHLISPFALSIIGRLNIGHEAVAFFIFSQRKLFHVEDNGMKLSCDSLPTLFLRELTSEDRGLQLKQSTKLNLIHDSCGESSSDSLSSLRCAFDYSGGSNSSRDAKFILPLGGIWIWNVLSISVASRQDQPPDAPSIGNHEHRGLEDTVSHALGLILQLETHSNGSHYVRSINDGVKLYHTSNVCLLPEEILRNDFILSALEQLLKHFTGQTRNGMANDEHWVKGFVKACFEHSRISAEDTQRRDEDDEATSKLHGMLSDGLVSSDAYSPNEIKALDDFVDDMCTSYVEYGAQYSAFTYFIRLFLRHDFPTRVTTTVLNKLHPILHLLTIEEEDTNSFCFSFTESISGGLPSRDSSRRDPSSLLDSMSLSLKSRDKELLRNDYVYLLVVSTLSRNLASSSQRCECGLQAMKQRLSRMSDAIIYDIFQVAEKFLRSDDGMKDSLVTCAMEICMNERNGLIWQDASTQEAWKWNSSCDSLWEMHVDLLRDIF